MVGRAELARQLLPRFVATHRDDPVGAHLFRRQHAEQADRAITHDDDRRAWLHVRRIGREPPSAEYVRHRQKTRHSTRGGKLLRRDQRAIRQRHAEERRLRSNDPLPVGARRLIARLTVRTRVVGRGKRSDHELAALDRRDGAADLFDDAAIFVTHGDWVAGRVETAIGPQIRPADARGRQPDHGIRRLDDAGVRTLVNADVARTVENCSSHDSIPSFPGVVAGPTSCIRASCRASPPSRRCRGDTPSRPTRRA